MTRLFLGIAAIVALMTGQVMFAGWCVFFVIVGSALVWLAENA